MAEQNSYRWYILAASFLILVIDGGVRFSFSVLIKPLVSEFSWAPGEHVRVAIFAFIVVVAAHATPSACPRFGPARLEPQAAVLE